MPENTLAAFARAFDDGADGIELDVRLARDGVPVVIHDAKLRRTGSMAGVVARMTSTQLAKIDIGSWFNRAHPLLARDEYEKECVPTLKQTLEFCSDRSGSVYIELKSEDTDLTIDLVRSVAELIESLAFHNRALVVSFDLKAIAALKEIDASIRTGALFAPARNGRSFRSETIISAMIDSGANEILLHRLLARPKLVERATDRNLTVVVWTVDDLKWVSRADKLGISALITNDPAKLLKHRRADSAIA